MRRQDLADRAVYDAIAELWRRTAAPPSIRDIAAEMDLSVVTVYRHVARLDQARRIVRAGPRKLIYLPDHPLARAEGAALGEAGGERREG